MFGPGVEGSTLETQDRFFQLQEAVSCTKDNRKLSPQRTALTCAVTSSGTLCVSAVQWERPERKVAMAMPCHTCCIEEGGAEVTFCRVKWRLVIVGLLRSAPKAGSQDAHRLLLGGGCSLVVQTQGALGGLGRVACPWPWAAPFPATVMLAAMLVQLRCLGPFPLLGPGLSGAQISPWPEVGSGRPTMRAHPPVLWTFHLLCSFAQGTFAFFWWFVWCWEGFGNRIPSNLGSEFTSLSPWLQGGGGGKGGEARGARKRRCDIKVKAHLARPFISYIICICHSDFRGKAYADLPGMERDTSHILKDAKQILICGVCIENRRYSGSTFYSAAV